MLLWHHPESDSLFTAKGGDWQASGDGALCNEVSTIPEMVSRYNRENPGYPVHLYQNREDGLGFCLNCRAGECEITTDCPGAPATEEQWAAVCAGKLDYWSGVWL